MGSFWSPGKIRSSPMWPVAGEFLYSKEKQLSVVASFWLWFYPLIDEEECNLISLKNGSYSCKEIVLTQ